MRVFLFLELKIHVRDMHTHSLWHSNMHTPAAPGHMSHDELREQARHPPLLHSPRTGARW